MADTEFPRSLQGPTAEWIRQSGATFLTVEETAAVTRTGRKAIYAHANDGSLPFRTLRVGRHLRIPAADVLALIEAPERS